MMFRDNKFKSTDLVKSDLKNENKNFNLLAEKNAELLKCIEHEKEKGRKLSQSIIISMQSILDENVNPEMNEFLRTALRRYSKIKTENGEAALIHEWLIKIKDFSKPTESISIDLEENSIKKLSKG